MMPTKLHTSARSQENPTYPQRFPVPDENVPWETPYPGYTPVKYFFEGHRGKPFADPDDASTVDGLSSRLTYEPCGLLLEGGTPVNPRGRTGMVERGRLAKWGPNHAADPMVTRYHSVTGELQIVVIKRSDTGAWALPGGMVDPGELVSATVKREFTEEAGEIKDATVKAKFSALTDSLFSSGGEVVYRGYVDDPRNTDNAWMETCALHFHCSDELGALLPLEAGDDAVGVKWVTITPDLKLYASHRDWIYTIEAKMYRRRILSRARSVALFALPLLVALAVLRRR